MTQPSGYLIARSKSRSEFFTASSAYDRPQWKPLGEATVYPTADLAQSAVTKLFKNGCYEARLVPVPATVTEAILGGTPGEQHAANGYPKTDLVSDPGSAKDTEMVAADKEEVCPDCGHTPCTCGDSEEAKDEIEPGQPDTLRVDHENEENEEVAYVRGDTIQYEGNRYRVLATNPDGTMKVTPINDAVGKQVAVIKTARARKINEEAVVEDSDFKMPAKPQADAQPSENKTTAADYNSGVKKVEFKQPAMSDDHVDFGGDEAEAKIPAPKNVISDLKAKIAEYEKVAEFSNQRDDARASFALTASEAMKSLLADIEEGTTESMKRAQINMTSWMSPIVNNVPASVQKFIYRGGKKSTLKDMFGDLKQAKKAE
jgi:hypothetical protein